jgi:predicted glycosyltransferase
MRVQVDIGHPAHVHFHKHIIWGLQKRGHEVLISARDKDVVLSLLDHYGFSYRVLSALGRGRFDLYKEFLQREWGLLRLIRRFDPHLVMAIGGAFIAPICKLAGKPSIVFYDTEHVSIDRYLTYPLASVICTPQCFNRDLKRQIRYAGFQELAYLHPKYFQPDPKIFDELGLSEGDPYIVLRFVAWKASHDWGHQGLSRASTRSIIETLSHYGRVFITSEAPLADEFAPYQITVSPARIHDMLAYASLYLGEGATMASEAAMLGTPSIYVSPLVELGYLEELRDTYGLVKVYRDPEDALNQAIALLEQSDTRLQWQQRRERLISEKIDVTSWAVDLIENYPSSVAAYLEEKG